MMVVWSWIFESSYLLEMTQWNAAAAAKSLQSCPTLCDPIDGSPPGSPIPGILQARTLEWVAISFSNLEVAREKGGVFCLKDMNQVLLPEERGPDMEQAN